MKGELKDKLFIELNKEIKEEAQVIYVLSCVRKIIESNKQKKKYKILKFYCDWALHIEINNTKAIRPLLDEIIEGNSNAGMSFFTFEPFHKDLNLFVKEYNLPKNKYNNIIFNKLLSQIYTDTPLIVKNTEETIITWKGKSGNSSYGGSFNIEKKINDA